MIAIISDVHGNYEALKAVLSDIDSIGVTDIISLGDIIGYGPFPIECYRLVKEKASIRILGNHEYAILTNPRRFNPIAAEAIYWTQQIIKNTEIPADIRKLKSAYLDSPYLFVHGSVENPVFDYVTEIDNNAKYQEILDVLTKQFKKFDTCFVGHNHKPFLCTMDGTLYPHEKISTFSIANQKLYVSIGSVGQPRDNDPRACYVILDGDTIHYRRVTYNARKTANAIIRRGLPKILGQRLLKGI